MIHDIMGAELNVSIRGVVAGLIGVYASPTLAQEAPATVETPVKAERSDKADDDKQEASADIVVTGSLIRGLPREYLASPVFTQTQADIVRSGAGSVSEFVLTIPQNFAGDVSEFSTSGAAIGSPLGEATPYNQFDGFTGFALRGLASDATLTLLNGRRMASVGMTESPTVSVIPSMLIERIDIIPDGASATYGADAVAGVVNIITRKPKDGLEVQARGSVATETGKKDGQISALAGHSWGSGNVYGMAMYQRRSPFITDPILVSGRPIQITQLPAERLSGLYAGLQQELGDFTFSIDASRFQRNRESRQNFPRTPATNRYYTSRTKGFSIYNSLHWQGPDLTGIDLTVDYGRNESVSSSQTGTRTPQIFTTTNSLLVAELRGQTGLMTLPAGPVLVAGGVQYRRDRLSTDRTTFFGQNGGEREVKSIFGEINVPFVGRDQAVPLIRSLTMSAAARYEALGFDSAVSPKVGLRWEIDKSIALRGTYARSFLAPRFRDTVGISEQVSFWSYDYPLLNPADRNPALPAGQALVMFRAGSNPNLKTQNADTLTVGIDFTPAFIPNLVVKTGYYRIKISGRVSTPDQDKIVSIPDLQVFNITKPTAQQIQQIINNPAVSNLFAINVPFINKGGYTTYATPGAIPTSLLSQVQLVASLLAENYGTEKTDGLDLDLAYRTRLLGGEARFHLTGQYILNLSLTAPGGTPVARLGGFAKPSDLRFNGSAVWGRGGFSTGAVVNYVDGFTDDRAGRAPSKIDSFTTTSVFFGVDLARLSSASWLADSQVQLVVANVFDRQPPRIVNGVLGFDPYNNPPTPRTIGIVLSKRFQ